MEQILDDTKPNSLNKYVHVKDGDNDKMYYNFVKQEYPQLPWDQLDNLDSDDDYKHLKYFLFGPNDKLESVVKWKSSSSSKTKNKYKYIHEWYPGIKAPYSTLIFWLKRYGLDRNESLANICEDIGNHDVNETTAGLRGYYSFWIAHQYEFNYHSI